VHLHTRARNAGCSCSQPHDRAGTPRRLVLARGVRCRLSSARICGSGGKVLCFAVLSPGLGFVVTRVVLHCQPPFPPALPLYRVNKQYRSTFAIACNLIAFVWVLSDRGR
jgi:hypothetical protein